MASTALPSPLTPQLETGIPSALVDDFKDPASAAAPSTESAFMTNLLLAVLASDGTLQCPLPANFAAALLRNDDGGTNGQAGEVLGSVDTVCSFNVICNRFDKFLWPCEFGFKHCVDFQAGESE